MLKKRILLMALTAALLAVSLAAPVHALSLLEAEQTVQKAKGLQLTPAKATLYVGSNGVGESIALVALVRPEGAEGALSWKSSKSAVASVDENGVVTAHKAGTAVITCRTNDGSNLKRTCNITVKAQPPTQLTLEGGAQSLTLLPGAQQQLSYAIQPANAVNQKVTWKSSKTAVAKVNSSGLVTAVKPGTAVITCKTKAGGLTAKITIQVGLQESSIYYLAVGQAEYAGNSRLPGGYDDAKRFAATLESCDFGEQSMTGEVQYNLTGSQLRQALAQLPSLGMGQDDVTYFYYSGHGLGGDSRSVRGALVGVDYASGKGASAYVTVDEVRQYLDQVPGTVVVVLDCCLSGQYITAKGAGTAALQTADAAEVANAYVQAFSSASLTAKGENSLISGNANASKYKILAACQSMQSSYATSTALNDYSYFTRFICQGAGITGAQQGIITVGSKLCADSNGDGYVSLAELKKYAAPKISSAVKKGKQTMTVWPAGDTFPIFARVG